MARLVVIQPEPALEQALADDVKLREHEIETCGGNVQAIQLARQRVVDAVITGPAATFSEDLAFSRELRGVRPAARLIVLAPSATSEDVVNALREDVFACFTPPFDYQEIVSMARAALTESGKPDGIELISGLPHWLTVRVSCQLLTAERLVRFVTELQSSLPSGERDLLLTAFREMLLNAMEHGAGFDAEKVIEVTAAKTARAIVYHFRDPGSGFDRADLNHCATSNKPEEIIASTEKRLELGLRPGGFGMLIVRQIVDELVYNERGNEVLLIKHLN
jgi:anti-sigma regulatory factor (Ser/Thr protein kinase)/ActR/RegA family two-component response regulator